MKFVLTPISWFYRVVQSAAAKFWWDDCFSRAAALAYSTLFALVPLIWIVFTMFTAFGIKEDDIAPAVDKILDQMLPSIDSPKKKANGIKELILGSSVQVDKADKLNEENRAPTTSLNIENLNTETLPTSNLASSNNDLTSANLTSQNVTSEAKSEFANSPESNLSQNASPKAETQNLRREKNDSLSVFRSQITNYFKTFRKNVKDLTALKALTLGSLFFVVIALLNTIESALNVIWRVTTDASIFSKVINFWAVVTLGPILIFLSFYLTNYIFEEQVEASTAVQLIIFLSPVIVTWGALTLLYFKLPSTRVKLHDAALGGIVSALLFEIAKHAFSYYVRLSSFYGAVYGVLASIPLFLFWLYVTWVIVLFGAEISYQSGSIKIITGLRRYATSLGEIGGILGLRILMVIGRNFIDGKSPPSESEIAIETGSDPVLVRSCLEILADANIITQADREKHLRSLVISPDKLPLLKIFETFRSKRHKEKILSEHELSSLGDVVLLDKVRTIASCKSSGISVIDWTLSDLLSA